MQTSKVGNELWEHTSPRAYLQLAIWRIYGTTLYQRFILLKIQVKSKVVSRNAKYSHVRGQSSNATFLLVVACFGANFQFFPYQWSDDLACSGPSYYAGFVTNLEETLEAHKQQTKSCFGTWVNKKLDVSLLYLLLLYNIYIYIYYAINILSCIEWCTYLEIIGICIFLHAQYMYLYS